MANTLSAPSDRWLYIHGFNALGSCGQIGETKMPSVKATMEDLTGPGCSSELMAPNGFVETEGASGSGWYSSDTLAYIQRLRGMATTTRILCGGMEGLSVGAWFWGYQGLDGKIEPSTENKAFTKFNFENPLKAGNLEWGKVLEGGTTARTATGTGSNLDNSTSSANGGVGYFQALSLTGSGSLTGKVAHSSDGTTFADLITFTACTAALATTAGQRSTVTGTVNRYLRAAWTISGFTSTNLFVGFKRN